MIRIFQPTLGEEEIDSIRGVFAAQWPGLGPRVREFEEAFATYVGAPVAQMVGVTSCTEGLFQAVSALDLDADSEVILPTVSFIGAAHAVRAAGACVRLVDVDPVTMNPHPDEIARALSPRTRAILVLHYGGVFPEIGAIADLSRASSVTLIEDAACALGGTRDGVAYGMFGDIGVWSFDAMKLLVTGDGGMIRITDPELRGRIYERVSLGGVMAGFDSAHSAATAWWQIAPNDVGRKVRMNDLTAVIGLAQLQRIDGFVQRRRELADAYRAALSAIPWIRLPPPLLPAEGIPYFFWLQCSPGIRDRLATYLRDRGVYTTFRYWPLHRTRLYADGRSYPGADLAAETTLLLPVHQNITNTEVELIVELISAFQV